MVVVAGFVVIIKDQRRYTNIADVVVATWDQDNVSFIIDPCRHHILPFLPGLWTPTNNE